MKKIIPLLLSCVFFALLFASCQGYSPANVTPTPSNINPIEIAGTMMQVQLANEATQQALSMQMSATAQWVGATSTFQAVATEQAVTQQARLDAQATDAQKRIDLQATQQRIDDDAATEQARKDQVATAEQGALNVQSTQQASGTATAFVMTQTAIPPANTLTQISNEQNIQLKNNDVELSNLEVEQQRQKNTPEWLVPFLIAIAAAVVGAIYVMRYSRVREIKNDDGEVELLFYDEKAIRPQLMSGPVIEFDKDEINMPQLTASAEQSRVTERAQAVDAIKNMPASTTSQAAQTFNKYFGSNKDDLPFEIIDAEDAPPAGLLDGETLKSLNKDWKEAKGE